MASRFPQHTIMQRSDKRGEIVLVLTPIGRDASLICSLLDRAGLAGIVASDVEGLVRELREGAGAAVMTEESLRPATVAMLIEWLQQQPPWSDFPIVVLTSGGESTRGSLRRFEMSKQLGNITLLERPVRSVTLLSAVEAALRARRRQYEAKDYIAERHRSEEVLVSQAEALARSNADLQQFAYVTSHDLQEPLRNIRAFAQMLAKRYHGEFDGEALELLDFISGGAARMHALIQDLLSYSRVVNDEPRVFAPVPMGTALAWAIQNLQLSIGESQAKITHDALPDAWGDVITIVQLLQNLLANAIKYRSERPLQIHVCGRREGAECVFGIRDNGIGMAPQYHERIFGLFKRLHGKEIAGTGIGLTICRKIVERHKGRIWVESSQNIGSTFWFTLPAAPDGPSLPTP